MFELFKIGDHSFRRSRPMARSFDKRVGAVTTSVTAPALGLHVEHPPGPQIMRGDERGTIIRFESHLRKSGGLFTPDASPPPSLQQARDCVKAFARLQSLDQRG